MLPNLVLLGLLAMGLIAALTLFISLKYEVRGMARKDRARLDAIALRLAAAERPEPALRFEAAAALEAAAVLEAAAAPSPELVMLRPGINRSKRVQAVRLLRRGEDPSHVAAALGVTRREIELLMRVQKLSAHRASSLSASAGGR
jgi:hypothetical protein